jgi:hypothetical protein
LRPGKSQIADGIGERHCLQCIERDAGGLTRRCSAFDRPLYLIPDQHAVAVLIVHSHEIPHSFGQLVGGDARFAVVVERKHSGEHVGGGSWGDYNRLLRDRGRDARKQCQCREHRQAETHVSVLPSGVRSDMGRTANS